MGVRVSANGTRLNQRDMRPSAARPVEVACHPLRFCPPIYPKLLQNRGLSVVVASSIGFKRLNSPLSRRLRGNMNLLFGRS